MAAVLDSNFIGVLLRSRTFVEILLTWGTLTAGLAVMAVLMARRLCRRVSWRALHTDTSGAATVVDFALTLPIFLIILLLIIQLMIMLNGALIVHYAAYAAARSARVWMWDADPWRLGTVLDPSLERLLKNPWVLANRSDEVRQRIERAARFALIAASPADVRLPSSPVDVPESTIRAMAQTAGYARRAGVLLRQARYAFDPQNARIDVEVTTGSNRLEVLPDLLKTADAWAVTATVSFRLHLGIPVARVLGTNRGDGHYYRSITAEVTLL
jgi:hypothetical protein